MSRKLNVSDTPGERVGHASAEIILVGTGPGPLSCLTQEAEACLLNAPRVLFRMSGHPVHFWLRERGTDVLAFDPIYDTPGITYEQVYELIAASVIKEAFRAGRAVYALPGHPFVFETTPLLIAQRAKREGIDIKVIPGVSFLDVVSAELRIDRRSWQICGAIEFLSPSVEWNRGRGLLIGGLLARASPSGPSDRINLHAVDRWLKTRLPALHPISLVWTDGMPDYATRSKRVSVSTFASECALLADAGFASAYVPPPV